MKLLRFAYLIRTFRDYGKRLNRAVDVEIILNSVADKKRGPLTPEECRELAIKLGVPEEFKKN